MRRSSRLYASVAGVSLATLGGSFFAVYVANNSVQERQLDVALLHEAREEAREAAQAGGAQLMISPRPGPAANDVGPLTKYAAIYDRGGGVLAQTRSFEGAPPTWSALAAHRRGRPFDLWHESEHLRAVLVPIEAAPHTTLLLAAPRTDLDGDEAFLGRAMLIVFGFAFAWVLAILVWVVRRFTRGHEAVAQVARRVAEGDHSARVVVAERDPEVQQLAQDVNHMIVRLSSLLASHRLFVAHAAHELRSPLTALYGELSHALRRSRDSASYREAIEEALASTKRLMTLAEDLLTLARLSGESEEPGEWFSLDEVLARASKLLEAEMHEAQVELAVHGRLGDFFGRPLDLERLLRNLLENAVRHALPGSLIEVRATLTGDERVLRVRNRGLPIPPDERERVFEPFVRGSHENARDVPGTGLGLAIARQIALAHAGSLELGPYEAEATELVLRLPKTATKSA